MTMNPGDSVIVNVPAGFALTVTVGDATAVGTLQRIDDPGGSTVYPTFVINGVSVTKGPFASPRNYKISNTAGTFTYAVAVYNRNAGDGTVPTAVSTSVAATETGDDAVHKTVLNLANLPVTMRDTQQGGGVEIYDFPEGRILILGATGHIIPTTHSAIASTLNSGVTCNWGLGTVTQANGTLATTEQDLIPVTAWTSGTTIDVAPAVSNGALAASAQFDGTATAKKAFLNLAVAGATDIDADASILVNGAITIVWAHLGDY